jgi:hypothetical protein
MPDFNSLVKYYKIYLGGVSDNLTKDLDNK